MKILPDTNLLYSSMQLQNSVSKLGTNVKMPDKTRNYMIFDENNVSKISSYREKALPYLDNFLKKHSEEKSVCEALYTINRMCDLKVGGIGKYYGTLSKFNNTNSPNIQVLLAGIYRKIQVPDGFGPLINMLVKNAAKQQSEFFDPNEEIGGAILEYIKKYSTQSILPTNNKIS